MPNNKSVGIAFSDPALDGAVMGATGGTAGFYGKTPVAQPAAISTVDLNVLTTTSVSYLSTAQISALQTSVNSVITSLKTLGITA